MKKISIYLLPLCFLALDLGAQSLNSPESILWDDLTRRFLITNAADGTIQAANESGGIQLFSKEAKGSHGLSFYGRYSVISCFKDELYLSDRLTGSLTKKYKIPGALFLNGICTDASGNVYVSDFSRKKIFKVIDLDSDNVQVTALCTLEKVPNGIIYEAGTQQVIVLTWGSKASILHVNSGTGKIEKSTTTLASNLEGIIKDPSGGYFITSWVPGGLYHYDGQSLLAVPGYDFQQPTGLAINGSPELYVLSSTDRKLPSQGVVLERKKPKEEEMALTAFPNPMSINSLITYELPESGAVNISVYDCQGNLVEELVTEQRASGRHQFFYNRGNKLSGLYFINIQTPSGNKAIAVTLVD